MIHPRLIVFDLDGTLVDSLPDIAGALNRCLRDAGLATIDIDVVKSLVGGGVGELAEKALALQTRPTPISAAQLADAIVARYRAQPCIDTRPYDGIEAALDACAAVGSQLCIITNKAGSVARALVAALGWTGRFVAVIGDGDGHPRKPAPDAARTLLERFAISAGATLVVGDGLPDLALARALGCRAAAAAWGYTDRDQLAAQAPAHLLDRPGQLIGLVGSADPARSDPNLIGG